MPQITKFRIAGLLLIAGLLFMAGCGSEKNPDSSRDADGDQHAAGWLPAGHAQPARAAPDSCAECHGSDLSGGISKVSCTPCHLNGSPFVLTNCTSCHGNPPSGSVAPNRTGAHNSVAGHFAAQVSLPDGCNTCHSGAGSGTVNHDTGTVVVSLLSPYNAKSGIAAYNADGTCSKVSCHGGQQTPVWLTGTIDVNTQCTSCHSYGTSEYNSFVSGQHGFHVNSLQISCVACHDTVKLAVNHFTTLNTSALEGPASATINSNVNYDGSTCMPLCHGKDTWQ